MGFSPKLSTSAKRTIRLQAAPVPGESCTGEKIAVVGATGYIGKSVVKESIRRGYPTAAVMRDVNKSKDEPKFQGATLQNFDVTDRESCLDGKLFPKGSVDVVVCCLASRTGTKSDSYAIDYQASLNCAEAAKAAGARRFILLSAYCVKSAERKDPYALQFQYAKMELEQKLKDLTSDGGKFDFVSVRPTAFFKSVSGQLEVVDGGGPFVYFDLGNDRCARCNPISEPDLAAALIDQVADDTNKNGIWNIGGPDVGGLSMAEQGEMIHSILEKEGDPKLLGVPIGIFDIIINGLQWVGDTFSNQWFDDAAELGRIGKYYAVEDMLTTDPSEIYGRTTLEQHYTYIAENGQEYDPYTTVFGSAEGKKKFQEKVSK
eukprot:CAMPEP_0178920378 /NCGR_PEP_ID=MMETSP0786-20121207/14972_1 /TAXON_ID=186022 /ORGANISM="Thalassionema frauenfeldii, Strain CCMP 1798" /LENGTH=373 /DNA_ID=CAMNT_0020594439 /DNA_START=188 /DNA_END=1309 /DNA_ORIENTATION=+